MTGVKTKSAVVVAAVAVLAVCAGTSAAQDENHIPWPSVLPGITVGPSGPPQGVPPCDSLRMKCVNRLVRRLRAEYRAYDATCDHRVIFSLGYLRITREIRERMRAGETFRHRRWFTGVVQGFSNLYFQTQRRYDRGKSVPESWRIYYEAMDAGDYNAGQDLLLASNAHTNHDLPYAYAASGLLTRKGKSRKHDHDGVNDVNASLFRGLARTYERRYDPFFGMTSMAAPLDALTSLQAIQLWRENAWRKAEALVAAGSKAERQLVQQQIEAESAAWARLITSGAQPGHRAVRDAYCAQHSR